MKVLWLVQVRHTQASQAYKDEQYEIMQGTKVKRESLEIMHQTQTLRYVSRFEPLRYVPAFTQKDFYYVHTGVNHLEGE